MFIKVSTISRQADTEELQGAMPETADASANGVENGSAGMSDAGFGTENDPGFAPISPNTPSWGPPSAGSGTENDPGFAPISPDTPSWGPPSAGGGTENDPGFAPISPDTPSWGPPSAGGTGTGGSGSGGTGSGSTGSGTITGGAVIFPIVVAPGQTWQSTPGLINVRFLHASTMQIPVNIRFSGRTLINRLQFGNSTPYYLENSGYQTIQIFNSRNGNLLYSGVFYFRDGTAYTIALVNNGSGLSLMQLTDMPCTNQNTACVRAVNLSTGSGSVDVFLSGAGRIFQGVSFMGVTSYRAIRQGSYRAFVSEALPCPSGSTIITADTYVECSNTRIAILDSANVNFMSGVSYTLYIIGNAYQTPSVQLLSLESDLIY